MLKRSNLNTLIFAPALALLMAFFSISSASAHTTLLPEELTPQTESITEAPNAVIIIIIIIKKKKKGVAEIVDMYPAESKSQELAANQIMAQASVEGGQLRLKALRGTHAKNLLVLPKGLQVSAELGSLVGATGSFGLKAGKVDFRTSKLGNFEIQD
jgi:hypothetical protein